MGVSVLPTFIKPAAIKRARSLRKNMTDGERKLWSELQHFKRWYGVHFRKQAAIGDFVVDFVAHDQRLIVEGTGPASVHR